MKPALVFVHGLANSKEARQARFSQLRKTMVDRGVFDLFSMVGMAAWRSRGTWAMDLADLAHPDGVRANEAIDDVRKEILEALAVVDDVLVLGHSMGQVLSVLAVAGLNQGSRIHLLTMGGPLGNALFAGPISLCPWSRPAFTGDPPCPLWHDVWNPDDRICCAVGAGYGTPTGAHSSIRIDVKGQPLPLDMIGEHGGYFHSDEVYDLIKKQALLLTRS